MFFDFNNLPSGKFKIRILDFRVHLYNEIDIRTGKTTMIFSGEDDEEIENWIDKEGEIVKNDRRTISVTN